MARYILCLACGDNFKLHPEDKARGFTIRKAYVSAVTPEGHGLTVNGEFKPLSEVYCDHCGRVVTGDVVVAGSYIPPERRMVPWEHEYGKVMTDEEVDLYRKLTKGA